MEIKWLKDGQPLMDHRRKTQKIDETTVILSLRRLELEDSGNYTCVAENRAGAATHTAILKVKGTVSLASICHLAFYLVLSLQQYKPTFK